MIELLAFSLSDTITNFLVFITENPVYALVAFIMLFSAIMVVTLRNIFHCAIFLVICLFSVAGIYILLEAELLAAVQILIYVGAIAILMIFAIMLTSQIASQKIMQSNSNSLVGLVVSLSLMGVAFISFIRTRWRFTDDLLPFDNISAIGRLLMTDFVLPFEVVSIVLLAAMIGAIVLARREGS